MMSVLPHFGHFPLCFIEPAFTAAAGVSRLTRSNHLAVVASADNIIDVEPYMLHAQRFAILGFDDELHGFRARLGRVHVSQDALDKERLERRCHLVDAPEIVILHQYPTR